MIKDKKMLAFLDGFSRGLKNADKPCTLFVPDRKGGLLGIHADSEKSDQDKFLDLVEEAMKKHNEYWTRKKWLCSDEEEK